MAVTRIILWLGYATLFFSVLLGLTTLVALAMADYQILAGMIIAATSAFVIGAVLILMTVETPSRETNSDALAFLLLFWILMPIIAAIPFWLGDLEPGLTRGYFHAVSAITTTGANAYVTDSLSPTLIFWQSLLQFCGGVSVATFAVVILAALNLTGTGVHRSNLFTLQKGDLFPRLLGIGRVIMGIYLFIASVCFIFMTLSGAPVFDALCLSLTGVSTGGMAPRSDDLSVYIPRFAAFVLAVSCAFGAMNISVIWDVLRMRNWRNVRRLVLNIEHRTLFSIALVIAILGLFYVGVQNLFSLLLEAIFFVSSAGFIYDSISLELMPSVVLIAIALIGGSALSTAGGLKVIRIILLFKHLGTDISRMSHPSRVLPVRFKGRTIPDQAFLSIWMYFFGYTLAFGAGIVALGAVGLGFSDAATVSASALGNIGPLLPATLPVSGLTWPEMTSLQMLISAVLMLIGRVEVLAVLVLMTPSFWRQ